MRPSLASAFKPLALAVSARRQHESGSATLYAIGLLALCSMFIAMQLSILDAQNLADNIGVRSLNARRVSTASIGFVNDMLERRHLVRRCVGGMSQIAISKKAPKEVAKALAQRFDPSRQTFTFLECDPLRLPDDQLIDLAKRGSRASCPKVESSLTVAGVPCRKGQPMPKELRIASTVGPAHDAQAGARKTADVERQAAQLGNKSYSFKALVAAGVPDPPPTPKGCKFACHVNPSTGKNERVVKQVPPPVWTGDEE
jgi:hypothetical protein